MADEKDQMVRVPGRLYSRMVKLAGAESAKTGRVVRIAEAHRALLESALEKAEADGALPQIEDAPNA